MIVAELERGAPEGNIESIPDGRWWAITTITTVGYGDTFPTTPIARGFAVVLMLVGVSLFGLLAASLASFLIHREDQEEPPEEDPAYREILERLERIEQRLEAARDEGSRPSVVPEEPRNGRPPTRLVPARRAAGRSQHAQHDADRCGSIAFQDFQPIARARG